MNNYRSCILLCGGMSKRMGQDKGSMIVNNKPMIINILETLNNQIDDLVIVLNNKERIKQYETIILKHAFSYPIKFVEDIIKNKGPLSGIMTGLKEIKNDYGLIIPCDSPFISSDFINYLFSEIDNEYQGIIPYYPKENNNAIETKIKNSEPLHSIYKKTNFKIIEEIIKSDILNVKELMRKIECKFVAIDNKKLLKKNFKNLNTPEDVNK